MRGRAKRRDANEPQIVEAFRRHGCSVTRLDGIGIPDLLVGLRGRTWLVEVKLPLGPRGGVHHNGDGAGDFTADQVRWWNAWLGEKPTVVRTDADVERLVAGLPAVCGMHGDDCNCADRGST